jgi:prepilin-type N-terminal cleavage/methylation domain-containing protein
MARPTSSPAPVAPTRPGPARARNRQAFTLMELMVATAVISIIMLGVYNAFSTGLAAWRRSNVQLASLDEGRYFLDTLSSELSLAWASDPNGLPPFVGDTRHMSFLTTSSLGDGSPLPSKACTRVTYDVVPVDTSSGARPALTIRRTRQFYSGGTAIGEPATAIVLAGLRDVQLRYLSRQDAQDMRWSQSGPPGGNLPAAVQVQLVVDVPAQPGVPSQAMRMAATAHIWARAEANSPGGT